MYGELADWWPLLSPPSEYAEEAAFYTSRFRDLTDEPRTLLELGSGGGNNASHMKHAFAGVTLVDRSREMLAISRRLNPDCEHVVGDMRSVRLGRTFDCVFVHDAICYATSPEMLRQVLETAATHCRPGGVALFAPDFVRETFVATTDLGGHDGDGRGLRYLEWAWDPDPDDTTYIVDYALVLRATDGSVEVRHDRHVEGLFSEDAWLEAMREAGFAARSVSWNESEGPLGALVFVGVRT